jgi:hypothetical protein
MAGPPYQSITLMFVPLNVLPVGEVANAAR